MPELVEGEAPLSKADRNTCRCVCVCVHASRLCAPQVGEPALLMNFSLLRAYIAEVVSEDKGVPCLGDHKASHAGRPEYIM